MNAVTAALKGGASGAISHVGACKLIARADTHYYKKHGQEKENGLPIEPVPYPRMATAAPRPALAAFACRVEAWQIANDDKS